MAHYKEFKPVNNVTKQPKKTANTLAVIVIFIVSVCSVLACFFSGYLAIKDFRSKNTAYADSYLSNAFYSSNVIIQVNSQTVGDMGSSLDTSRVSGNLPSNRFFSFILFSRTPTLLDPATLVCYVLLDGVERKLYQNGNYPNLDYATVPSVGVLTDDPWSYNIFNCYLVKNTAGNSYDMQVGFACQQSFNYLDIIGVHYFYKLVSDEFFSYVYYCYEYFDSNNYKFDIISFYRVPSSFLGVLLDERTYYFDSVFSGAYNQVYGQGYYAGYQDGNVDGLSSGYDTGYSLGYSEGEIVGYNHGVNSSNEYTFNNLFASVIDAPVQALTGLLNFNILGVNLYGFFTGLLTLCLILWVIKMILGGA